MPDPQVLDVDGLDEAMNALPNTDAVFLVWAGDRSAYLAKTSMLRRRLLRILKPAGSARRSLNLREVVTAHVLKGSSVHTDEHRGYRGLKHDFKHGSVNHSAGQYVRRFKNGDVITTNGVESSFSLLKRGVMGAFHHISRKHMEKYAKEFEFRYDDRKAPKHMLPKLVSSFLKP